MATKAEIDEVWKLATAAYPNFKAPAATLVVWGELLADIDFQVLRAAVLRCVTDGEFFPTVHALRQAAAAVVMPSARTGLEAWGDVKAEIRAHGYYDPPGGLSVLALPRPVWHFRDPIVETLVASIGWATLCHSEDEMADRAHFVKAYEAASVRAANEARQLPEVQQFQQLNGRRAEAGALMGGLAKRLEGGR